MVMIKPFSKIQNNSFSFIKLKPISPHFELYIYFWRRDEETDKKWLLTLYTLESLHIFLDSNYQLFPWLKKLENIYSSVYICASSGISVLIKYKVAVNSISISHQNGIAKTPFTQFISLKGWDLFFLCMLN